MQPTTEDIVALTQLVWDSVLHLPAEPAGPTNRVGGAAFGDSDAVVNGSVSIDGPWTGTVTVACNASLAATITARMYKIDPSAATEVEIDDAIGEIANMVGGNVKAMLPGPSTLSLPTVVRCQPASVARGGNVEQVAHEQIAHAQVTHWMFATGGLPFSVSMTGAFSAASTGR